MAKPAAIPPIDATPEELARMLLQLPKSDKPEETADKSRLTAMPASRLYLWGLLCRHARGHRG